ncbi:hypothetical protein AGR6A_Cc170060 [Agrobacterium sp. NCPPB 925]|nr:hypothetical protein AGR6A_Cc170060 [Agrobacterium sp. NCPPB 925]
MDKTTQKSSAGEYYSPTRNPATIFHDNGSDPIIVHFNIKSIAFDNSQVINGIDFPLHRFTVESAVSLRARPTNGRTLFPVEHTELNARSICDPAHQSIQRIDLTNEMTLSQATNCGITGHDPNRFALVGNKSGFCTMPCSGSGSFTAGMTATNNNDIE